MFFGVLLVLIGALARHWRTLIISAVQRSAAVLSVVEVRVQLSHGVEVFEARWANCVINKQSTLRHLVMDSEHVCCLPCFGATSFLARNATIGRVRDKFLAFVRNVLEGLPEMPGQGLIKDLHAPLLLSLKDGVLEGSTGESPPVRSMKTNHLSPTFPM